MESSGSGYSRTPLRARIWYSLMNDECPSGVMESSATCFTASLMSSLSSASRQVPAVIAVSLASYGSPSCLRNLRLMARRVYATLLASLRQWLLAKGRVIPRVIGKLGGKEPMDRMGLGVSFNGGVQEPSLALALGGLL